MQKSLQVCRRIFGGMLTFSRNAARRSGYGQVRRAIETASAILKYGMSRERDRARRRRAGRDSGGRVRPERPRAGAPEPAHQRPGGDAARRTDRGHRAAPPIAVVEIAIADTGCGIPPEHLARVLEPFFTTKPHGNGLGLSICRSVIWEVGGTLDDSRASRATAPGPRARPAGGAPAAASQCVMRAGPHPRRRRRAGHAARGRARAERRPSRRRHAALARGAGAGRRVSTRTWRSSTSACRISTASS